MMNHLRSYPAVTLLIILAVSFGCSSKKESADKAGPRQQAMSSAAKSPQKAGQATPEAVVAASPQDEADAALLKEKVLAQVKAADFAAIYKEASAGFREVGPEKQFTALWQQQLKETGPFKEAKEISHAVRPEDKFLVYVYQVQYAKVKKELRLTFGRSKKGKMELTGINHRATK